ncbi:MAG TPA: FadR/GntR family transcriptional regulator [Acetobacteraceae bacterium]|nr:FadR/GntR family transcriptional regulator [Acetobacteraceae bacterium]
MFTVIAPPRTLTAEVAAKLADMIETGALSPGQKLPPEHELVASLKVSRSVLREAVATLRAEGMVNSRRGAGVFVSETPNRRPFRLAPGELDAIPRILEVLELRAGVEIEAAGLAALRGSREQKQEIRAIAVRIRQDMLRGDSGVEADFSFHMKIAEATGNPRFPDFIKYLGGLLIPRRGVKMETTASGQRAYADILYEEHSAIEHAIRLGDANGARTAMRRHLIIGAVERYRARALVSSPADPEETRRETTAEVAMAHEPVPGQKVDSNREREGAEDVSKVGLTVARLPRR